MNVSVHLACNDDNGGDTDRVGMIEIYGDDCNPLIGMECPGGLLSEGEPYQICVGPRLHVRGVASEYACGERQTWVGNMAWDAVEMEERRARLLVEDLIAADWTVEEACEGWPGGPEPAQATIECEHYARWPPRAWRG